MGADLRRECAGVFRAGAQVGLHRQVEQLKRTRMVMNVRAQQQNVSTAVREQNGIEPEGWGPKAA